MKRSLYCLPLSILLLAGFGSSARAQQAPAGPILAFTLDSLCDKTADLGRLNLGLHQAATLSDFDAGRASVDDVHDLQAQLSAFQDAYSQCLDKELALEMATLDPTGDPAKARSALEKSVADFSSHASNLSESRDPIDQRIDVAITRRYLSLRQNFLLRQAHLVSVKPIHNYVLDFLNSQIQGSVDCRNLAKRRKSSAACEKRLESAYLSARFVLSREASAVEQKVTRMSRDFDTASALLASAMEEAEGVKSEMENIQSQSVQPQARMRELIAASDTARASMNALGASLGILQGAAGWYYNAVVWCQQVGYRAYLQGDWWNAGVYYWWGGYYLNWFYYVVYQQIPQVMNLMAQTQKQMAQMKVEIDSIEAKMRVLQVAATVQLEKQASLTTLIPRISGEVGITKQAIISFVALSTPPMSNVAIVSHSFGQVVDVSAASIANGASLRVWDNLGASQKNQRWNFVPFDDRGSYWIVSLNSSKCLDVTGASKANEAAVIQWQCHGGSSQVWRLVRRTDDSIQFVSANSGKCLEIANGANVNGTLLQQNTCTTAAKQSWTLQ